MRALRLLTPAIVTIGLIPLVSSPASAAPPDNDTPAQATVIALGDSVQQDTTEATTDSSDTALNANCGAPFTGASVWYQYTPSTRTQVVFDTAGSDYSTGVMVFDGTPTADSLLACGPEAAGLATQGGHTYYAMIFNDSGDNGGTLHLALRTAPTPRVHVTLAKRGVAYHGGAARVHGTYSCRHDESFSDLTVHLFQRAGRLKVQADTDLGVRCDGRRHAWSARMVSPVGTYARGRAVAKATLFACGYVDCREDRAKQTVRLRWASASQHHRVAAQLPAPEGRRVPMTVRERHWPGPSL